MKFGKACSHPVPYLTPIDLKKDVGVHCMKCGRRHRYRRHVKVSLSSADISTIKLHLELSESINQLTMGKRPDYQKLLAKLRRAERNLLR